MKTYHVTESAPAEILGQPVEANGTIRLNKTQAEHHINKGHLVEAKAEEAKPAEESSVDLLREEPVVLKDLGEEHAPITDVHDLPPADQESSVVVQGSPVPGVKDEAPRAVRPGGGKRY